MQENTKCLGIIANYFFKFNIIYNSKINTILVNM